MMTMADLLANPVYLVERMILEYNKNHDRLGLFTFKNRGERAAEGIADDDDDDEDAPRVIKEIRTGNKMSEGAKRWGAFEERIYDFEKSNGCMWEWFRTKEVAEAAQAKRKAEKGSAGAPQKTKRKYNEVWQAKRREERFQHVADYGGFLPKAREILAEKIYNGDIKEPETRAAVAALLVDKFQVRTGSESSVKWAGHHGLTDMTADHIKVNGSTISIEYIGKSGVAHFKSSEVHPVLAKKVAQMIRRAGKNGKVVDVDRHDVNYYIKSGTMFTIKDFRTFHTTQSVYEELKKRGNVPEKKRKSVLDEVIKKVAAEVGQHEPATCKKNYVDTAVISSFMKTGNVQKRKPSR